MILAVLFLLAGASLPADDLEKRLEAILERAGDLDPEVRSEAAREAEAAVKEHGPAIEAMAASKVAARAVLVLAGGGDPQALLKHRDPAARVVACDRLAKPEAQVPALFALLEDPDIGVRLAACRALVRPNDSKVNLQVQQR